jgi:LPS-assembly protein
VTKEIDVTRTNTPVNTPTTKIEGRGGVFDPDIDIIRAGQRMDFRPEVSYPFHIGNYIDVLPALQFRHTQYSFNVSAPDNLDFDPAPFRQFARGRISFKTRYYRVYGPRDHRAVPPSPVTSWVDSESRGQNPTSFSKVRIPVKPNVYRHEIEPEITASGVPYIRQTGNFGEATQVPTFLEAQPVSDSDFQTRGIQFDTEDRLIYRNSISLMINNKLVRKTYGLSPTDDPAYKQIVSFKLGQGFDLDEYRRKEEPKFAWSDLSALLDVRMDSFETNTLARYFHYHNVISTSSRARIMTGQVAGKQSFVEMSFAQTFSVTRDVREVNHGRAENVGFAAGFDSRYLTFLGSVNFKPWQFWPMDYRVLSWGTEMRIKPPGDCWGIRTKFEQSTGDELRVKVDFDYLFGGQSS